MNHDLPPSVRVRCVVTSGQAAVRMADDVAILDQCEQATLDRFAFARDRRDYAAAHALLRRMLSEACPSTPPEAWQFTRDLAGKPYLVPPPQEPMHFSLSHTRGMVACATSLTGTVGIDIECEPSVGDFAPVARDVCSDAEQALLTAAVPAKRNGLFLDLWTLKEAYLKACGTGIGAAMDGTSFDLLQPQLISAPFLASNADAWWLALFRPDETSRLALAVKSGGQPLLDATVLDAAGSRRLVVVRSSQ